MTQPVLEVRNLTIRRGASEILSNMNWQVGAGENWAILGPNGSGKTSLLNAVLGYFMPTSGGISLSGKHYGRSDWRELRKSVGYVSSGLANQIPEHEAAETTVVSGKAAIIDHWKRVARRDVERARELLAAASMSCLAGKPWGILSQGERQKVLIVRAMMGSPKVLILDEPCAGLDPVAREEFLWFLDDFASGDSTSLVLVTHHVEEITPSMGHVLLLRRGSVLASGAKEKVLTSAMMSVAYGGQCRIVQRDGRYRLTVAPPPVGYRPPSENRGAGVG